MAYPSVGFFLLGHRDLRVLYSPVMCIVMKKLFYLIVCLLISIQLEIPIQYRLFFHYLQGSGEEVSNSFFNKSELDTLHNLCRNGKVTHKNTKYKIITTYGAGYGSKTPMNLAMGSFSCTHDGLVLYDRYDFMYEKKDTDKECFKRALFKSPSTAEQVGKCIVRKGFGKSFDINIKF